MFLINITFALCIIGTIFLAIGIDIKNRIVRNIGIAVFSIVIIFWIWFLSWFFIDEDKELKSKMGEETTNNVSESTRGEDITSQVISNDSSIYKYGIIRKIKDNKITFCEFEGGRQGNTTGVSKLVIGKDIDEVILALEGIDCGGRGTSCPDQLAKALKEYKLSQEN